jgi:methionyl-tRNA formyltransferase
LTDRARTVFLGTGAFAVPVVTALAAHPQIDLSAVVTAPRRFGVQGKPWDSAVAIWSNERGLPSLRPERLRAPESIDGIRALAPDLLVLADYGQIVPEALLDLPPHGALNVHPSLLPRHRGATPIPAAILAGDSTTGVSVMLMDAGLDTGPLVAQQQVALNGRETGASLETSLADFGARLLTATLEPWLAGAIEPRVQNEDDATMTRPLRRASGRLDPGRSAAHNERQVRAYQPWPGSFLQIGGYRIIVLGAHPVGAPEDDVDAGAMFLTADGLLALRTADGGLALDQVQPAGGRRMSGADLVRGRRSLIGAKVSAPADSGS